MAVANSYEAATSFSIIIPARNEEDNIGRCVESILNNNYPSNLFEVIVVDDYSTDKTVKVVESLQKKYFNLKLIELSKTLSGGKLNSYKKKAIETGIQQAKEEWIVTTDADCVVTKAWLSSYNEIIQNKKPVFVAAPVQLINTGTFVSIFQCLDFLSLQGITAASVSAGFHSMCNGANLGYHKTAFYNVNGFAGIDNIASGDDMLLMHKIQQKSPGGITFLFTKNAVVQTAVMPDWRSFFNQRIRWASKADSYDDKRVFLILLLVYLLNLFLFIIPFFMFFYPVLLFWWVGFVLIKTIGELFFMFPVSKFYDEKKLLWWFPIMQVPHIVYTVIAGWLGKFGKYKWKGRIVK